MVHFPHTLSPYLRDSSTITEHYSWKNWKCERVIIAKHILRVLHNKDLLFKQNKTKPKSQTNKKPKTKLAGVFSQVGEKYVSRYSILTSFLDEGRKQTQTIDARTLRTHIGNNSQEIQYWGKTCASHSPKTQVHE